MSDLPVYSFFPWLRQGLGNQIPDADVAGRVKLRAEIPVVLERPVAGFGERFSRFPQHPARRTRRYCRHRVTRHNSYRAAELDHQL
jgi:hypothetical protein